MTQVLNTEATILSRYLVGSAPSPAIVGLYITAVSNGSISNNENELVHFAFKYPWLIGSLDGALALISPNAELRRRIYIMFALLEATPDYADYFLPRQRNPFFIVVIVAYGIRVAFRAMVGIVVIKSLRLSV